ncbi:hypothetical protein NLS1_05370 [Nocardioides sp. LS1]|nr:hypothetical protein NLS1_05370 [Nocardioides sp. LS1]
MTGGPDGVVPMLAYRDGPEAMDWLAAAFGFREEARWLNEDGVLTHGEMVAGRGRIMIATPTPDYEGPRLHRSHCDRAAAWSRAPWVIDGVLVYVDDVAAHFDRAKDAGATPALRDRARPRGQPPLSRGGPGRSSLDVHAAVTPVTITTTTRHPASD